MFLKKSKKSKKFQIKTKKTSRKHKKITSRKYKKNQKGGNYGTLHNPNNPSVFDGDKKMMTIVLKTYRDQSLKYDNNIILEQEILDVSDIKTYEQLTEAIQRMLDKYNAIFFSIHTLFYSISDKINLDDLFIPIHKCFLIMSANKLNPIELCDSILKSDFYKYLYLLSAKKSVATFSSGINGLGIGNTGQTTTFNLNFKNYSDEDKSQVLEILNQKLKENGVDNRIELQIFSNNKNTNTVFYSVKHLNLLCEIFGYDLDYTFDLITNSSKKSDKDMAFIYIAFGDLTDIKITVYKNDVDHAKKKFKPEFMPLFEEYKRRCQSDPELAQPGGWE